jgi:hypothetical protein
MSDEMRAACLFSELRYIDFCLLRGSRKYGYSQGAKLDVFGRPFGPYPFPQSSPGEVGDDDLFFRFFSNIASFISTSIFKKPLS